MTRKGGRNEVTEIMSEIRNLQLPPRLLRELGLEKDWNKKVPQRFIEEVLHVTEKYKEAIKALADQ